MDKQYSVQFFSEFVEAVQRLCRDYLDFDQAVEIGGYLSIEIDNFRKERYVLSEMLQKSGNVISESYCTKAFKTHSRCCADKNALRERHSNVSDFGSDTNSSRFTCASDSQMSGLETGNTQRSLLRSNQLRSAVRTDHERTSSGGDGVSSGPLTDRLVVVERSGDCCSIETYSDGYETQKKSVSLLSSVQRSPMSTAACNNLVSDKSGEEMRTTKRVSSLSSSSPRTCKRERLQQDQGKSSSLSMLDNSAASYSETSYQTIPSDSVSKVVPGGLFSEPCVASSTEEAVRLPLGALVKEEPDSEDCVMVGGSSEEDSNLLDPGDVSGDVSFLLDPLQSGQPTADVHSRSAAYTESLSSSPADRPKVDSTRKSPKKVKTRYTNYSCAVCRYSTYERSNYNRHLKIHSVKSSKSGESTVCDQCGKKYNSRYALRLHIKNIHELVFKYHCKTCGRGFNQTFQFRSHCSSHVKIPSNRCSFCKEYFLPGSLKQHMSECKDNPKLQAENIGTMHSCDECEASFPSLSGLKYHVTGKHKPPTYKCPVCDRMFAWRSSLKAHMNYSHGYSS
ncbi:zinc finger protein 710-like [Gigantopelta aegis]|uniref:zinc finger protein 710-like n=1 Tax=Gigantopelta aegis TaxID=1735272 RepID=UPI001B8891E8|nr:zinc finger protein 710-like [Gigantopelta aegis]